MLTQNIIYLMSKCIYHENAHALQQLAEQLPQNADLSLNLAKIYQRNYTHQKAIEYYLKVWQLNPELVPCKELAYCFKQNKEYERAIEYYRKVPQSEHDEHSYSNWAYCYREIEAYQECIRCYEAALSYDAESTWYLGNIGWCYQHIKHYYKALIFHLRAYKIAPSEVWNLDNIGYCYQRLKTPQKAIKYYKRSLEQRPDNSWTLRQLGWTAFITAQIALAKESFDKAYRNSDRNKTSEYSLMNMAHVYWCVGDKRKARQFYRKSVLKFKSAEEFSKDMDNDYQYIQLNNPNISAEDYQEMKKSMLELRSQKLLKT